MLTAICISGLFAFLFITAPWGVRGETAVDDEGLARPGGALYACKCYPGEPCYPKSALWAKLNATVHGQLQVAYPPGAPCYPTIDDQANPTYDADQCKQLDTDFMSQDWQVNHPIANMWTHWTNDTCLPPAFAADTSCTRGFYGQFVLQAKTAQHVQAAVDFARKNNIRLVIRNTGHDFMGRSTGYGSLVLNTHGFKNVSWVKKYAGPGKYRGGAVKIGAGVQVGELYKLARAQKPPVVVIGGECATVGLAGGYIQGGGHGPMASFYGMAADQALEFEVVTANGEVVIANEAKNPDLFWALKGGGPSTFGVLLSVIIKTHPEVPTAGIVLDINATHTTDAELFWKGVAAMHDLASHWVNHGMFVNFELWKERFHVQPIVGPNMTVAEIQRVAKPMFDRLQRDGVPYSTFTKEYPTFYDLYTDLFEGEGAWAPVLTGGRLFTRRDIARNASAIVDAYRVAVDAGAFMAGHVVGPGYGAPVVDNAIHPAWRDAAAFTVTSVYAPGNAPLAEKAEAHNTITNVIGKVLRDASPFGAAYVNEGDVQEPDWQNAYWGKNYPRLYRLKHLFDPQGVFYAPTTPGTEGWELLDGGKRLCRKSPR